MRAAHYVILPCVTQGGNFWRCTLWLERGETRCCRPRRCRRRASSAACLRPTARSLLRQAQETKSPLDNYGGANVDCDSSGVRLTWPTSPIRISSSPRTQSGGAVTSLVCGFAVPTTPEPSSDIMASSGSKNNQQHLQVAITAAAASSAASGGPIVFLRGTRLTRAAPAAPPLTKKKSRFPLNVKDFYLDAQPARTSPPPPTPPPPPPPASPHNNKKAAAASSAAPSKKQKFKIYPPVVTAAAAASSTTTTEERFPATQPERYHQRQGLSNVAAASVINIDDDMGDDAAVDCSQRGEPLKQFIISRGSNGGVRSVKRKQAPPPPPPPPPMQHKQHLHHVSSGDEDEDEEEQAVPAVEEGGEEGSEEADNDEEEEEEDEEEEAAADAHYAEQDECVLDRENISWENNGAVPRILREPEPVSPPRMFMCVLLLLLLLVRYLSELASL